MKLMDGYTHMDACMFNKDKLDKIVSAE